MRGILGKHEGESSGRGPCFSGCTETRLRPREFPGSVLCMNRALPLLAAFLLAILTAPDCRAQGGAPAKVADPRLVKTFTATKALKLDDAVADFVIDLVRKNTAGVQDQYRKLTAGTEANAGGRYSTRRFEGIQWFVNEHSAENNDRGFQCDDDYTYLARQQLIFGFHRGFSTPVNVIGQVRVVTSISGKGEAPVPRDGWVAAGAKVTFTFEGFLNSVPVQMPE
jgi:hypothetical protein